MSTSESEDEIFYERKCVVLEDFNRFKQLKDKKYEEKYPNIYSARLSALKQILTIKAREKWGNHEIFSIKSLSDFDNPGKTGVIIGTLYKFQELEPLKLKDYSEEIQVTHQPKRKNYSNEKDELFIEDKIQRIKLASGYINSLEIVTGIVCAVLGHLLDNGTFWVQNYCLPGLCPQLPVSKLQMKENKRILLLSGLDFFNTPDSMKLELLTEWITGIAGDENSQNEEATICQIIIAGNSIRGAKEKFKHTGKYKNLTAAKETVIAANRFDDLLNNIVESCCVLLMPGEFDPSNYSLPQQPIHACTLPKSSRYKTFQTGTNPWIGKIDGRIVAGSSGQIIEDMRNVTSFDKLKPLELLEKTLTWRHFAPTSCYLNFEIDPFVMQECPDIYFVGNMDKYETKLINREESQVVRLICIPKFSKTQQGVIVDLETLDTWPITFG